LDLDVHLDQFEGPLDLLLHLIRKQDIDIFDIPIARITRQFLDAISDLGRLELERAGEFIEMAAALIRIKGQLLFPRRDEEEVEDPRADLVRRLLEYEHFREVARVLDKAERERSRLYPKGFVAPRPLPSLGQAPLETEWNEVWEAISRLTIRLAEPEPGYRVVGREVKIDEKIDQIVVLLEQKPKIEFTTLVAPWGTRIHAIMSLLASLELAKRSRLRLRQKSPFASLWLYRRGNSDAA
jgi:segregation and condensation protein A